MTIVGFFLLDCHFYVRVSYHPQMVKQIQYTCVCGCVCACAHLHTCTHVQVACMQGHTSLHYLRNTGLELLFLNTSLSTDMNSRIRSCRCLWVCTESLHQILIIIVSGWLSWNQVLGPKRWCLKYKRSQCCYYSLLIEKLCRNLPLVTLAPVLCDSVGRGGDHWWRPLRDLEVDRVKRLLRKMKQTFHQILETLALFYSK